MSWRGERSARCRACSSRYSSCERVARRGRVGTRPWCWSVRVPARCRRHHTTGWGWRSCRRRRSRDRRARSAPTATHGCYDRSGCGCSRSGSCPTTCRRSASSSTSRRWSATHSVLRLPTCRARRRLHDLRHGGHLTATVRRAGADDRGHEHRVGPDGPTVRTGRGDRPRRQQGRRSSDRRRPSSSPGWPRIAIGRRERTRAPRCGSRTCATRRSPTSCPRRGGRWHDSCHPRRATSGSAAR